MSDETWRKCGSCRKAISFRQLYWVCNVSTCNRKRTGLAFCSVSCWDAHLPLMNHRESWAEERKAPTPEEWAAELAGENRKPRAPRKAATEEKAEAPAPARPPTVIIRKSNPQN